MFEKLFAERGLSLDRLRSFLEVAAAGSIVRAANCDPVRQSQCSRQIKELETFFRTRLVERHGKGLRVTRQGRELARLSRFFLLGLSSFQRGCLAAGQTYRIAAPPTFAVEILAPALAAESTGAQRARFAIDILGDQDECERRLHDLRLDFAVMTREKLSRPLQSKPVFKTPVRVWVPKRLGHASEAAMRLENGDLPLALASTECPALPFLNQPEESTILCGSYLEARRALETDRVAAPLPDFLRPARDCAVAIANATLVQVYFLAWNPRLLRLNPRAEKRRDALLERFASLRQPPSQPVTRRSRSLKPPPTAPKASAAPQ